MGTMELGLVEVGISLVKPCETEPACLLGLKANTQLKPLHPWTFTLVDILMVSVRDVISS